MNDEYAELHPILNEMSNTIKELYEHRGHDEVRQKLIALERDLRLHLESLQSVAPLSKST